MHTATYQKKNISGQCGKSEYTKSFNISKEVQKNGAGAGTNFWKFTVKDLLAPGVWKNYSDIRYRLKFEEKIVWMT